MSGTELLEIVRIFGLIVAGWFVVVGWKLLPLLRIRRAGSAETSTWSSTCGSCPS